MPSQNSMDNEARLSKIEALLSQLLQSDRYTIHKTMQIFDGRNIQLGTTTGTKIGTAATQKIGFFGKTPIVQAIAINAPSSPSGIYVQAEAQSAVTAINSLQTKLTNLGLTA